MAKDSLIPRWKAGEPLKARKLNEPVDQINRLKQVQALPAATESASKGRAIRAEVLTEHEDYLKCYLYNGDTRSDVVVNVAKPPLLRQYESRDSITYTYSSVNQRQANNGAATEDQEITPGYVAGDEVWIRPIQPFADIKFTDANGVTQYLTYIDENIDARAWAAVQA